MTISSTNTKNSYSGDGSTVAFSYTFKILDDDDITVILRTNATGAETVQTKTTHYSVSGVGNAGGGTITFVSAPATTVTVVLLRNVPLTQTTDYTPNDPFPAVTHEDALDKLTLMAQDTQEEVDRSIKLSRTNTMTSTEFTVGATDRANKVFAFDSSGELAVTQEIGTFQGNWAASTAYAERDLVKDTSTNNIFIVNSAHTSSGSQPLTTNANASKYDLIVDAASATTSATNAATSATAAATSATAAANSASAAATSESNAAASESSVSDDATAAAASAASASTSATNASTSETNASNSASAASTSATNAATSATSASNSASAAGTSESNAATSATNASNSASAAATSASNASTSESNASTSETNAATSASSAASDASAAATSAASAAASFDAFDDIYLGAKASAPTVDNDGDALTNGDLYFDTGDNELYIWNGSAWQAASPNIVADTTPQLGGDLDLNSNDITGTGNINVTGTVTADQLNVDNIRIDGNTISSTDTNGNVNIDPAGTGSIVVAQVASSSLDIEGDRTDAQITLKGGSAGAGIQLFGSTFTNYAGAMYLDATASTTGTNDAQMVFRTGSSPSEAMRIDRSGNVGIGNSTPGNFYTGANQLVVGDGSGDNGISLYGGTSGVNRIYFADGSSGAARYDGYIEYSHSSRRLLFGTAANTRMTIDSSGNVGINTTGPTEDLHIKGKDGAHADVIIQAYTGYNSGLNFNDNAGMAGRIVYNHSNNFMEFDTNGTERLRIQSDGSVQFKPDGTTVDMTLDASGNLLVGKTNNALANDGIVIRGGGEILSTNTSDLSGNFNRLSTDGGIVGFYKDGTTVGSIKSADGVRLVVDSIADGKLSRNGTEVVTWTSDSFRAVTDNSYDLGRSANRFKDLYLSGGAYLGGTGSANYLDDYEEGNFTVTVSSGISISSYDHQLGHYVKVGRQVTAWVFMEYNGSSRTGAHFIISGLPFNSSDSTSNESTFGGFITYQNGFSNTNNIVHVPRGTNIIQFYEVDGSTLIGSELSGASGEIRVVVQYTVP
jgi:hypothetical protein